MSICWVNGSFVDEAAATLSIFDRGTLFGDGVYEVAAVSMAACSTPICISRVWSDRWRKSRLRQPKRPPRGST